MRATSLVFTALATSALLLGSMAACQTGGTSAPSAIVSAAPSLAVPSSGPSAVVAAKTSARFGAPLESTTPFVELGEIVRDPRKFEGQRVRTRGEVVAVCQAAGCWTDLRPEGATSAGVPVPTHVTMHRHAFFLPKDLKGKSAEIEGTISVRTLTKEECDHYNGEGASLVAGTSVVGVDALGVDVR